MNAKPTYDLDLDRAAAFLLLQMLVAPRWAGEDRTALYRAGQLLERPEFEFTDRPAGAARDDSPADQRAASQAMEAWGKLPCRIDGVTEKQRDACKKAAEHAMKEGLVGASTTLNRIIRVLGLAPEE